MKVKELVEFLNRNKVDPDQEIWLVDKEGTTSSLELSQLTIDKDGDVKIDDLYV